jgi:hypothetical protein
MKRFVPRLTYANVVATLALVIAVGGASAFAASKLPKNSVGTKQIKKGAVTPAKLAVAAKSALTGPAGPIGPTGPQGAKGDRGEKGEKGGAGEPGPFPTNLPTGKSLSGFMSIFGTGTVTVSDSAAFAFPLLSAPTPHFIDMGGAAPAGCTGDSSSPGADPGNLCIFVIRKDSVVAGGENGPGLNNTTDTRGFSVFAAGATAGQFNLQVRWVVTAG